LRPQGLSFSICSLLPTADVFPLPSPILLLVVSGGLIRRPPDVTGSKEVLVGGPDIAPCSLNSRPLTHLAPRWTRAVNVEARFLYRTLLRVLLLLHNPRHAVDALTMNWASYHASHWTRSTWRNWVGFYRWGPTCRSCQIDGSVRLAVRELCLLILNYTAPRHLSCNSGRGTLLP